MVATKCDGFKGEKKERGGEIIEVDPASKKMRQ